MALASKAETLSSQVSAAATDVRDVIGTVHSHGTSVDGLVKTSLPGLKC